MKNVQNCLSNFPAALTPQGIYLWCNYIEPELKLVHIAQHLIQFRSITGNVDFSFILSLLQSFFLQDNFIQRVTVQSNRGISVFRFSISRVVQHAIFQLKLVLSAVAAKVNIKHRPGITRFFTVDMYSRNRRTFQGSLPERYPDLLYLASDL